MLTILSDHMQSAELSYVKNRTIQAKAKAPSINYTMKRCCSQHRFHPIGIFYHIFIVMSMDVVHYAPFKLNNYTVKPDSGLETDRVM